MSRQHNRLGLVRSWLGRAEQVLTLLAVAALTVMLVMLCAATVARKGWGVAIPGVYEITEYLMVMVTFLPFAYLQFRDEHIAATVLRDRLPARGQRVQWYLSRVVGLCVTAVLAFAAFRAFDSYEQRGVTSGSELDVPLVWPMTVVIIGVLLNVLELAFEVFDRSGPDRRFAASPAQGNAP